MGEKKILLDLKGTTINDLLAELCVKNEDLSKFLYDSSGNLPVQVNILVNGHSIRLLNGTDTVIRSDDRVKIDRIDILETIGGG